MNKETSSRVSTIAAGLINLQPEDIAHFINGERGGVPNEGIEGFCSNVRTLAASCMSQDETAGQGSTNNFLDRLKRERADLSTKVDGLGIFLSNNAPGATPLHKEMLGRQLMAMSEYLAILDERLADLAITDRSAPVEEIPIGNEDDR